MLKVFRIIDSIKEEIEVDQYIPIKIRWVMRSENAAEIIYWRTGDLKKSMLEIGISAISGEICSLTIVFADNISFASEAPSVISAFESGTPVFDVSNSGSRYSTWEAAYQDRFHDPRNVRAGGAVPNTGLNNQPYNDSKDKINYVLAITLFYSGGSRYVLVLYAF